MLHGMRLYRAGASPLGACKAREGSPLRAKHYQELSALVWPQTGGQVGVPIVVWKRRTCKQLHASAGSQKVLPVHGEGMAHQYIHTHTYIHTCIRTYVHTYIHTY